MSQAFYRKYRPKIFSEVIGQEHVVQTLTNALKNGAVSHGYLFAGPRGSGKTTIARLLAKALNCQKRKAGEAEPCNRCSSCAEINEGRNIDLIEIDAASHRGIDEIRELKEGIGFAPTKSKYKVFILDESHQLTKEAFNALLKTLEEPPRHAIFILATTEIQKMMSTIVSRCQRFDFRRLKLTEIIQRLEMICEKEGIKIEKAGLELIALNSSGSFRDAESILDQATTFATEPGKKEVSISAGQARELLGLVETQKISRFVDLLVEKKASQAIDLLNQAFDQGADPAQFAIALIGYLHACLLFKIGGAELHNPLTDGLTDEEFQTLKEQAGKLSEAALRQLINLLLDAQQQMKYSPIIQLPLELAIVEFCGIK
jgi:DNA polymerase-3 subunit gamma/tau